MVSGSIRFSELKNTMKIKILPLFLGLEAILLYKIWAKIRTLGSFGQEIGPFLAFFKFFLPLFNGWAKNRGPVNFIHLWSKVFSLEDFEHKSDKIWVMPKSQKFSI